MALAWLGMAPPAAPLAPPPLRLSSEVRPQSYAIHLQITPGAEYFTGDVDIQLQLDKPTEVLWLNGSSDLNVESASVQLFDGTPVPSIATLPGGTDFLGFRFANPLAAGRAKLHLHYRGRLLAHEGVGLFREHDGQDDYVFSDFEPFDARRAFPCFDEPSFKVPVQFTLDVPMQHLAASNAPVQSEQPLPGGLKRVVFQQTPPLPSYLWALAVGPFEAVDAGTGGARRIPLRILTLRGRQAEAHYAASVTAPIVDLLERYTGVPFPYDKLDQISVPNQSHAMENPGLVTYGQRTILLGPQNDTAAARRRFARVCAHELAHHWTGDLVTLRFWDELWLNESFASFLESKITEQFKPDWQEPLERVVRRGDAMDADSLLSARRIRQPIVSSDDIVNAFDPITYAKGQSVLTMMESWLGAPVFQRGLHRYLIEHAHGNATAADFLTALTTEAQSAGIDAAAVSQVLQSFLDQPGVPLLTLRTACERGNLGNSQATLQYAQRRYLPLGVDAAAAGSAVYQIPLCLKSNTAGRNCRLLQSKKGELPLAGACPNWLQADVDVSAYARIKYEGPLLEQALAQGFPETGTATLNTAQQLALLIDLGAQVRSGDLPAERVLPVIARAARLPGRYLIGASVRILYNLRELVSAGSQTSPNLAAFVRKVFAPRLLAIGLQAQPHEEEDVRLLRATLLPLVLGEGQVASLQKDAERLLSDWLADADRHPLDAESLQALLVAAPQRAGRPLWDALHKAALKTQDRNLRSALLDALGAFREPQLSQASLELIRSGEFEMREAMRILWGAASRPESRSGAHRFVKQHFDALVSGLPRDAGANLAKVAAGFCDDTERLDAEAFFTGRSTRYVGGPRVLRQTLERIAQCTRLRQVQGEGLRNFLAAY